MSCKVDPVGFCSCPRHRLHISLKQMEIDACKTGYNYERRRRGIYSRCKDFPNRETLFSDGKKQQQPFMYILTSQLEQVEKEFIAFYALKWIDKRPPLRQFTLTPQAHYVQSRFKFTFFVCMQIAECSFYIIKEDYVHLNRRHLLLSQSIFNTKIS